MTPTPPQIRHILVVLKLQGLQQALVLAEKYAGTLRCHTGQRAHRFKDGVFYSGSNEESTESEVFKPYAEHLLEDCLIEWRKLNGGNRNDHASHAS